MTEHAIAIQLWDGPIVLKLAGVIPSPAKLDEIAAEYTARNCGVRPNVRVLCHLTLPSYVNEWASVCEELQGSAWLDHGHARGIEGQQRASLRWR